MKEIKIAVLDLYEGQPGEGMRCIRELIETFARRAAPLPVVCREFDVRQHAQMPGPDFDLYVSSGGPGSPVDSEGSDWERKYFHLMDGIRAHNRLHPQQPKRVFLICHSFQIFCRHYGLARITRRKSTSFGVFPVHCTAAGLSEPFFAPLQDPLWAVDSRDWQVTGLDEEKLHAWGGSVLCYEKVRPHVELERAVMAVRFDDFIFGTQFHPEADAEGMLRYFQKEDKRNAVIGRHGEHKYHAMIRYLADPDKIALTHDTVLPAFLATALPAGHPARTQAAGGSRPHPPAATARPSAP